MSTQTQVRIKGLLAADKWAIREITEFLWAGRTVPATPEEIDLGLIARFDAIVEAFRRKYSFQAMDAEDSYQESVLALLEKWRRWEPSKGETLAVYLNKAMRHYASRGFRRSAKLTFQRQVVNFADLPAVPEEWDDAFDGWANVSPSDQADTLMLAEALRILDEMPEEQRKTIRAAKVLTREQKQKLTETKLVEYQRKDANHVRAALGSALVSHIQHLLLEAAKGVRDIEPVYQPEPPTPVAEFYKLRAVGDNVGLSQEDDRDQETLSHNDAILTAWTERQEDGAGEEVNGVDMIGMGLPLGGEALDVRPQWKRRTRQVGNGTVKVEYNRIWDWETTAAVESYIEQGVTPAEIARDIATVNDDNGWMEFGDDRTAPSKWHAGYYSTADELETETGSFLPLWSSEQVTLGVQAFLASLGDGPEAATRKRHQVAFVRRHITAFLDSYPPDAANHLAYVAALPEKERKPIRITARQGSILIAVDGTRYSLRQLADKAMLVSSANKPLREFIADIREKFPTHEAAGGLTDAGRLCSRLEAIKLRDFRVRHEDQVVPDDAPIHTSSQPATFESPALPAPHVMNVQTLFLTEASGYDGPSHTRDEWNALAAEAFAQRKAVWDKLWPAPTVFKQKPLPAHATKRARCQTKEEFIRVLQRREAKAKQK